MKKIITEVDTKFDKKLSTKAVEIVNKIIYKSN